MQMLSWFSSWSKVQYWLCATMLVGPMCSVTSCGSVRSNGRPSDRQQSQPRPTVAGLTVKHVDRLEVVVAEAVDAADAVGAGAAQTLPPKPINPLHNARTDAGPTLIQGRFFIARPAAGWRNFAPGCSLSRHCKRGTARPRVSHSRADRADPQVKVWQKWGGVEGDAAYD